jgi:hypothetical protein
MFNHKLKVKLHLLLGFCCFFSISAINLQPSLCKPIAINKIKIKPSRPTAITRPAIQKSSSTIRPEILEAIKVAKQHNSNYPKEKSQLETSSQYENRIAEYNTSFNRNGNEVQMTIPVSTEFGYDADKGILTVRMGEDRNGKTSNSYSEYIGGKNVTKLKIDSTDYRSNDRAITCTNGLGAKFNYKLSESYWKEYGFAYIDDDKYREKDSYYNFRFAVPMTTSEVRRNITADEKNLNGNLKFIIKLKPTAPFYLERTSYSGKECGDENTRNGGYTSTYEKDHVLALFEIVSLKLIDSSSNNVLLERTYK